MKEAEFKSLDHVANEVDEVCAAWLESDLTSNIRNLLQKAAKSLPKSYSLELSIELRVFDTERESAVRILSTGLNFQHDGDPYRTHGDSTPQRYLVRGEICELPHDFCPHCWGPWDFKLLANPTCRTCGYALGRDVRILLDSDVCPNCEEGQVGIDKLICDKCGFELNSNYVSWG